MAPFCSCPASLVSRKFFAVGPGCAKCFFLLRSVGAATFRRGQSKKKDTTQGVFFLLRPRGKAVEGEARGQSKKLNTTQGVFFCCGPGERQGKEKPRWAPAGGQSKKENTTQGPGRPTGLLLPLPFAGAGAKKKHPGWCFFFALAPCRHFSFPCLSPGPEQKKNTPWVVLFFCCGPAQTLTHSLRAWVAMPPPRRDGVCFFCCGPARTGVVFFFCCGPARTLTHSLWAGAISARSGWCLFFLLRPRRVFLDNNKKCLGYYIESKKTRRGHSKKKTPLPSLGMPKASGFVVVSNAQTCAKIYTNVCWKKWAVKVDFQKMFQKMWHLNQ